MPSKRASKDYIIQSRELLQQSFPHVSQQAIEFVFNDRSNLKFTDAYHQLKVLSADPACKLEGAPDVQIHRRYPRRKKQLNTTNGDLCAEIDLIPELNQKLEPEIIELLGSSDDDDEEEGADPPMTHQLGEIVDLLNSDDDDVDDKSDLVECKVCYADVEPSEMYSCEVGEEHAVCKTCITRFVSEQLHGKDSLKFPCIGDAECDLEYQLALLDKALPDDLSKRVNERVFHEIAQAEGIWTCPGGCGHTGFVDGEFPWINCPGCSKSYCTSCNGIYHDGKKCDEVRIEKERLRDPRQKAYEAMSQACKRYCPHCKQEYMKADGCNKIKCIKCKKLSCYLCGKEVADYSHFCHHPRHGTDGHNCGKTCQLWTNTNAMEEIDRSKRREAGRKVLTENGITDEKEILSILQSPPTQKNLSKTSILRVNANARNNPILANARAQPEAQPEAQNEDDNQNNVIQHEARGIQRNNAAAQQCTIC